MSAITQPTEKIHQRRRGKVITASAAALSAALLISSWLVDMGSPLNQERWRWLTGVTLFSIGLAGAGIVFSRHQMRAIFRAPLAGLFYGLVAVTVLSGILAGIEWFLTQRTPVASLGAAALVGLPAGAVIGVGIGLIGWTVFRLVPARAPEAGAHRKRPRLQFSLRTMLFGVLVIALLLWIGMPAQRSYQRQRAVSRLLESGARLDFEKEKTVDWFEALVGSRLGPEWYADVRSVSLGPNTTDEDLTLLEHVTELRDLVLQSPEVTDVGLAHLARLRALGSLYLECPQVTSEGLGVLEHVTELRHLGLQCPGVTDAGMAHLARLRALESLWLACPQVTGEGLGALAGLPELDSLQVERSLISGAALAQLMSPPKLRSLELRNVTISRGGLSQLPPLPIRRLTFNGVNITDADLQYLAALPAIEHLTLTGTSVTDAGLAHLAQSRTLSHLVLSGAGFTGKALAQLSNVPNLTSLGLDSMSIQDNDLSALTALTGLQTIGVSRTLITDAGLAHLEALPKLRQVSLYGTWATKPGADKLRDVLHARNPPGTVYGP